MGKIITKIQRERKRIALLKLRRAIRIKTKLAIKLKTLKALNNNHAQIKKMIAEFEKKFNF